MLLLRSPVGTIRYLLLLDTTFKYIRRLTYKRVVECRLGWLELERAEMRSPKSSHRAYRFEYQELCNVFEAMLEEKLFYLKVLFSKQALSDRSNPAAPPKNLRVQRQLKAAPGTLIYCC